MLKASWLEVYRRIIQKSKAYKMKKRKMHAGEFIWIIQLICIAADLVFVLLMKSDVLRIALLRANKTISLVSISIGVFLCIFGSIMGYVSHEEFNRAVSESGKVQYIIRDGFFKFIRHPFYLSLIFLSLSLVLFFYSYILLVGWVLVTSILVREAQNEETLLIEEFGEEYVAYQRKTGMFVPKLVIRK
jgi:protein-S-isoprenylcysteine O-methyltransferase Ste14